MIVAFRHEIRAKPFSFEIGVCLLFHNPGMSTGR